MTRATAAALICALLAATAQAQEIDPAMVEEITVAPLEDSAVDGDAPLRLEITEGVVEPMPIAVAAFEDEGGAADLAQDIARLVAADLAGSGLFRTTPQPEGTDVTLAPALRFDSPVNYEDWQAIGAEALVTGAVRLEGDRIIVRFRLFDVYAGHPQGDGMQFDLTRDGWRRAAHKIADQVYQRITGEGPYFDSRVVFVAETGPKTQRRKRIGVMDYDGGNVKWLTSRSTLVLSPRMAPDGSRLVFTSYETGRPSLVELTLDPVAARPLVGDSRAMTFGARFSPDGRWLVYSRESGGNTDIWRMDLWSGAMTQLTSAPSIETSPAFSPDGGRIVFESDRSGSPQLYVMPADGGEAARISFGAGRYGSPAWSPRGDLIAFTRQIGDKFQIGLMRPDGSAERVLTESWLDEGPTWSPNGRVVMFTREAPGADGQPSLYMVDISGSELRRVPLDEAASDPAWGPLMP